MLYGIFSETSVTKLLIAGILPGLLTAAVYGDRCWSVRCLVFPEIAPKIDIKTTPAKSWRALRDIWPLTVLILGIIGGLLSGVVTPTEAGAYGAFLAYVIAFVQGRLTWTVFQTTVRRGGHQHLAAAVRRGRRHPV